MVYLLHFSEKIGKQRGDRPYSAHAQHYIGCCSDLEKRVKRHRNGRGGHLARVASERGISFFVARVWDDKSFDFEKFLKRKYKKSTRLCPICNPGKWQNQMTEWKGTENDECL